MAKLSSLRNIGKTSEDRLKEVGIHTVDDLRQVGVIEAYRRLKAAFPDFVSLNALYAMEAGLIDIDWRVLPDERKAELRAQISPRNGYF
jgi:DNA transformation protein